MNDNSLKSLIGKRIEIPACYDLWMRGARYGAITSFDGHGMYVKMDNPRIRRRAYVSAEDFDLVRFID